MMSENKKSQKTDEKREEVERTADDGEDTRAGDVDTVLLGLPGEVGNEDGPCGSDDVWTEKNGEYKDEEGERTKRTRRNGAQLNLCSCESALIVRARMSRCSVERDGKKRTEASNDGGKEETGSLDDDVDEGVAEGAAVLGE
jgi:hypothetical protein